MLGLVVAHLVLACLLPLVSARSRRAGFAVAAVLPTVALVWALANAPAALTGGVTTSLAWAPELGLALSFRLDALALAMVVLVSGIGALILVYCIGYFGESSPDATRSAALLLAFAGVMLGLVLADDLLTLYLFWELTSVTSFLLVGQSGEARENRSAAVQALLVTVFGGLVMLLGFVLLGEAAGTYRISEIVALGQAGALGGGTVTTRARADPRRRADEVRTAALPPLAPGRDGRTDAGQRLPARGVDGEGGRVPRGPALAGIRGRPRVVGARRRARPGDDGRRRLARDGAVRPQAAARVRHRQPARLPHGPVRRGHPDRGHRRDRDAARTRLLQGAALPRDRHRRPRDRHPGRAQALRDCGRPCAAARSPPARRRPRWPGCRRCSASSARRPGSRRSSPRTTCAAGSSPSRWSRARSSPSPTAPGSSGARSGASPASPTLPCTGRGRC